MRIKPILVALLAMLLVASAIKSTQIAQVAERRDRPMAVATAQPVQDARTIRRPIVWYTDPVVLGLGLIAIFVLVDLAMLLARDLPDRRVQIQR